jgi:hypothetical protein
MVTEPIEWPVIIPAELTVAVSVSALIQVPPAVASYKELGTPVQTDNRPAIGDGTGDTVTTLVAGLHPGVAYDIVVVPAPTLVSVPEVPMVATEVTLLFQAPPATMLESTIVDPPAHSRESPVIIDGGVLTLIGVVVKQPVAVRR